MDDNTIVTSAWLDQEDRHVTDCIRTFGCYIQVVTAEDDEPGFAYTVGLFGIGHPELLVFGLDMAHRASPEGSVSALSSSESPVLSATATRSFSSSGSTWSQSASFSTRSSRVSVTEGT